VSRSGLFSEERVCDKVEQNDPVWKEYVDEARIFDTRMVDEWNKFLDVTLVFVSAPYRVLWHNNDVLQIGLFITVLTSFIIETQKSFKRDPVEVSNQILVFIFNELSNNSSDPKTLDLKDPIFGVRKEESSKAMLYNALLFISLAFSIAISMVSVAAKLWLIQYIRWIRLPGSDYHRAMQRQKAYTGMQRWKLHRVIDSLPLLTLVAVFLFGVFIQ
jgi:hypothetical protein